MATKHNNLILLRGSRNLADDVEAHLIVLVDLGLDVEGEPGAHAMLDQAGNAVIVLGRDCHHRGGGGIGGALRSPKGSENRSAGTVCTVVDGDKDAFV